MTPSRSRPPRSRQHLARTALLAAVAALGLSACSGPSESYDVRPAAPVDAAAATPLIGTVLTANSTAKFGTVVIDGQGYTLYRSDDDGTRPPVSNCTEQCAQERPPVLATPGSPLNLEGVPEEVVGTINRPDGSVQLTLGGSPVYRFRGDVRPGAVAGASGPWAPVKPDGKTAAPVR